MSDCKTNCRIAELCAGFARAGGSLFDPAQLQSAVFRLAGYAASLGKQSCGLGVRELAGFMQRLYSLEKGGRTADDSFRETYIIQLFYDYLVRKGCVAENPLKLLKQQAVTQLAGELENRGCRKGSLRQWEENKETKP